MSTQSAYLNGSLVVQGDLSVPSASTTVGPLTVGTSGLVLTGISTDTTMSGDSAAVVPTQHAVKTYPLAGDAATVVAANAHTDAVTLHTYTASQTFTGIGPDAATSGIVIDGKPADTTNELRISYDNHVFTIASATVRSIFSSAATATITVPALIAENGLIISDMRTVPGSNLYVAWGSMGISPYTIPSVVGPTLVTANDYAGYLFPGASDATYFASMRMPLDAEHGTVTGTKQTLKFRVQFSTTGSSSSDISITLRVSLVSNGAVIPNPAGTTTVLRPSTAGVGAYRMVTQYLSSVTTITPGTQAGQQMLLSFKRNGSTDLNNDDLIVWGINISYKRYTWGAQTADLM